MASLPGSSMEIFISNWESIIFKLNPTLIAIIIIFVLVAILVPISGFLVCCCKVSNILLSILDHEYFNPYTLVAQKVADEVVFPR